MTATPSSSKPDHLSRRRFLKTASAATLAVPTVAAGLLGREDRPAPSERITVGFIGCGKMANDYHLPEILRAGDAQAVAVCEVDSKRREHAQRRVESEYSKDKAYKGCAAYNDFRDLVARADIDAVVIATPDHWHAIPAVEALKAKKDVYCEKPLTLTLAEAKLLIDAARKHDRVFQVGSQQRSSVFGPFRKAVEIVRSGRLGKVQRVTVGVGGPSVPCDLGAEDLEPGLDWSLWLGPAPERPYHSVLSPRGVHNHFPAWRNYREYSGGGHTDMGAHHYDIAQWALDKDESGPVRILPPGDPEAKHGVKYTYEDGVEVEHVRGPDGCEFFGAEGSLHITRGRLSSNPERIAKDPLGEQDVHLYESPGHHRNWLDCVRSRKRPVADVEAGARTVAMIHLGNLAYWNHREIAWDPKAWRFAGDEPAPASWLDRERREPWGLPSA
jgi:predicted dehydrogenase